MIRSVIYLFLQLFSPVIFAQQTELNSNWQFRQAGTTKWYKASVPGTVHTDLYKNKLIPNPFFAANETGLEWIDKADWEYKKVFSVSKEMLMTKEAVIYFEGLDTYATVFVNNKPVLQADNMFKSWQADIWKNLQAGENELRLYFHSSKNRVDSMAKTKLPVILPDNSRVYARKAQYQFGWDWGPKFVGAGIWKKIYLMYGERIEMINVEDDYRSVQLVQEKDSIGTGFYFKKDGEPVYIKGANWIPADIFLPSAKKQDYRTLLLMAKDAGMNMLRVWGGGIYEDDYFYELCDSLEIMVWQDFMFAGGMYPGDKDFFSNVKAEVKYQLTRLKKFNCIVLWCGNNEIDEAWHHWGWQQQFNLHRADSARLWNDYTRLFRDSLKTWVKEFDNKDRPYVSTSPQYGWGNPLSYKNGDSHYWGLWWGLEGWEKFKTHTGRFISEWGMQAMPDYSTVEKYTSVNERYINSPAVNAHQKANDGFKKLNHYVNKYFFDSSQLYKLSLEEYTYLTQCVQYYILKNSIATQMSKQPFNMGTLIWQLNDCWPVTSWSIIDYYKHPKAGFYAVKHAYQHMDTATDKLYPKDLPIKKATIKIKMITRNSITIETDADAKYISIGLGDVDGYLSDNYFDLKANEEKTLTYNGSKDLRLLKNKISILSLADILLK
ncbi:MAG: glycoside hydrolase family 2 protein [Rhizobacter sp.]|nr:glycoside hydrolase family 2 protein [Ferruginibacter sp.]